MAVDISGMILEAGAKLFMQEILDKKSPIYKKAMGKLMGQPAVGNKPGTPGMLDTILDNIDWDGSQTAAKKEAEQATKKAELEQDLKRYRTGKGEMVAANAANVLANAAGTVGNALGTKNSILGNALMAMANQGNGMSQEAIAKYGNPYATGGAILGTPLVAKGAIQKLVGDAVQDTIKQTVNNVQSTKEKNRQTELLLRQRPNGQFYDSQKQLQKYGVNFDYD